MYLHPVMQKLNNQKISFLYGLFTCNLFIYFSNVACEEHNCNFWYHYWTCGCNLWGSLLFIHSYSISPVCKPWLEHNFLIWPGAFLKYSAFPFSDRVADWWYFQLPWLRDKSCTPYFLLRDLTDVRFIPAGATTMNDYQKTLCVVTCSFRKCDFYPFFIPPH